MYIYSSIYVLFKLKSINYKCYVHRINDVIKTDQHREPAVTTNPYMDCPEPSLDRKTTGINITINYITINIVNISTINITINSETNY